MKKKIILLTAAFCIACGAGFTSCKKSNKALIEDINQTFKEGMKAMKEGDSEKGISLMKKVNELSEELSKRELTNEERSMIMVGSGQLIDEINAEE